MSGSRLQFYVMCAMAFPRPLHHPCLSRVMAQDVVVAVCIGLLVGFNVAANPIRRALRLAVKLRKWRRKVERYEVENKKQTCAY